VQGVLEMVPPEAECIYVGKRGGKVSYKQPQIDQLLVEYCTKVSSCCL
jgi:siroheme synthase